MTFFKKKFQLKTELNSKQQTATASIFALRNFTMSKLLMNSYITG